VAKAGNRAAIDDPDMLFSSWLDTGGGPTPEG
jgi:hypothetical protein